MRLIAHKHINPQGRLQYHFLEDHLTAVAKLSGKLGEPLGLKHTCYCIGLFHDLGKSYKNFQEYILSDNNEHVNHSSIGGIYLSKEISKGEVSFYTEIGSELVAYVIFAHHGLFDLIHPNDLSLGIERRRDFNRNQSYNQSDVDQFLNDCLKKVVYEQESLCVSRIIHLAKEELITHIGKLFKLAVASADNNKDIKTAMNYYLGLSMRLLLSILKEADIHNSVNAFVLEKQPLLTEDDYAKIWKKGQKLIERKYEGFKKYSNQNALNKVRTKLALQAKEKSSLVQYGSLKAELPTGSGKTLLTTRFALNNCMKFKKKRFLYVTAFLSVLEQNANEIKELLQDDPNILEHHSNVVIEEDEYRVADDQDNQEYFKNQYFMDSWESPIILTTMVQFMNTLFKSRSSNIRRFCKLIDSVIILDEVQNLPTKVVHNFNLNNNYLTNIMGATIVHCTATQPDLDSDVLTYRTLYTGVDNEYLAKLENDDAKVFKRVRAFYLSKEALTVKDLCQHIQKTSFEKKSILVIANTKKAVHAVFEKLAVMRDSGFQVMMLTTNQCAADRLNKINKIKQMLNNNEKIIVVSTQLIEAGVDIDFSVVYRSIAGVASIIQAMGRCNREGKLAYGLFYLFDFVEENLSSLEDLKVQKERTLSLLSSYTEGEIDVVELKKRYYRGLYKNSLDKDYPVKDPTISTTLLELLGSNQSYKQNYKYESGLKYPYKFAQNFKSAADAFELIDNNNTSIIVTLKDAFGGMGELNRFLINEYKNAVQAYDFKKIKVLLQRLQPYTISVYSLDNMLAYVERVGDAYFLLPNYYDEEIGMNVKQLELLIY